MEILWPALGIGAIVMFIFYVLAQRWQRVLRQQSWTIRRLADRVQDLEEMADPEFRRRLSESAPVPLEQVFTLTFRLSDRFWGDAIHTTEDDMKFIREFGTFVGSVKLERWRSHTVATITEVLPDRKATGWQTRSFDFYPDSARNNSLTLWELALSRLGSTGERPPSLELLLRENRVELVAHLVSAAAANGNGVQSGHADDVLFRVPLDASLLAEFRSHDPSDSAEASNGNASANSWQAFYSHRDDKLGIEWQLRLRDLNRKSEWDRWKILESTATPVATGVK